MLTTEEIRRMPKLDLHCHLDGSLSPKTVRRLAEMSGVELPAGDEELEALLRAGDDCKSLEEYLRRFDLPLRCLRGRAALREAAYSLMKDAAEEGVCYLEMRFAPLLSTHEGLPPEETVDSVLEGMRAGEKDFPIRGGVILCAMRHFPAEDNLQTVRLAASRLGKGVCGVDIAGDEAAFPLSGQTETFRLAAKLDLPYTIHAGECGDPREVELALDLGAGRVGHGIAMRRDPALLRRCARLGTGVELCPVSNLQTKAAPDWGSYPLRLFMEEGICATVNTDNRTVSATSMTREYLEAQSRLGLSEEELRALGRNAVRAAFAEKSVKDRLMTILDAPRPGSGD